MIPAPERFQSTHPARRRALCLSVILLICSAVLLVSCGDAVNPKEMPPPTVGDHPDSDMELKNKKRQREYFEMMHFAAPNVHWRDFERENAMEAMRRRVAAMNNPHARKGGAAWREVGSHNQSGRIHAAAWSSNGTTLYAGADRGGLWKADIDGKNWTPLSDGVFSGVHEIGVVPAPAGPDILIFLYRDWDLVGHVYRSTDEGQTWTIPAGLSHLGGAKRILVLDDPDHTVFVLANKSNQWQVFVSKDLGATFVATRTLSMCGDIWTPRTSLGPVYVVDGRVILQTTDGGATWTQAGNPIPVKGTDVVLAGSEVPNLRFNVALKAFGAWTLWRSEDSGATWLQKNALQSYYDYWQSLVASTQNGDLISYAGTEMFVSQNGGTDWTKVNTWEQYYQDPTKYLHADIPGLFVFPFQESPTGERWYVGTDGGLYDSDFQMNTIRNLSLSGLAVSQYYSLLTSRRKPNIILAGSQDQGYQRAVVEGEPPPPPGSWLDFDQLVSGDYGHLTSSNGAHDMVYSVHPMFILAHEGEDDPHIWLPWIPFPSGETFPWMPYVQADPADPESFFFCAKKLYRYTRVSGATWNHVVHSAQDFSPGYLSAMAFSPFDPQRAYAATSQGQLYYSSDGGVTWTLSPNTGPPHFFAYGTTLLPSTKDPDVCWVAGSGYSNPPVYRTEDGGLSWQPESNGLPSTLVYCMAEAPDQSGMLFCGSESGAWAYDPNTRTWSDILGADAPITTYWACESVPAHNIVRFGTYSRGIWDYSLNTPGYFPYGELLGGVHVLELDNDKAPLIGQQTSFKITGCQPSASGLLAISPAEGEASFCGGTLLLDAKNLLFLPFSAGPNGVGDLTFTRPYDPAFVDLEVFFQAAAQDPGMVKNLALSNGLRAVIGE